MFIDVIRSPGQLIEKDERMKKIVTEMQLFAQEQREEHDRQWEEMKTLHTKEQAEAVEKAKQGWDE